MNISRGARREAADQSPPYEQGRKRNAGKGTREQSDDYRSISHGIDDRTAKSLPPWLPRAWSESNYDGSFTRIPLVALVAHCHDLSNLSAFISR